MKYVLLIITILGVSVFPSLGNEKLDEKTIVKCKGVVISYRPNGFHLRSSSVKKTRWYDVSKIKLTYPEEWVDHELVIKGIKLDKTHPLTKTGATVEFKIAKVYLVRRYRQRDGTYNSHGAGEGAVLDLKIISNDAKKGQK